MTNAMKYKTVKERTKAFAAFCDSHSSTCEGCPLEKACDDDSYAFAWLEMEAEEEKPLPCPFCGSDDFRVRKSGDMYFVRCEKCLATSGDYSHESDAIAAHNRVARAVIENGENEKDKKELTPHDSSARERRPEFVKMEEEFGFASRHGTEVGDDPVFDELYDYAAKLRTENSKYKETK